jgi:hypothetical protein
MGKYLYILKRAETVETYDKNDRNDKSPPFGRISRFGRTLTALESRCPEFVAPERWQHAVDDGRAFLARWGEQAEALGWSARDLFGLTEMNDVRGQFVSKDSDQTEAAPRKFKLGPLGSLNQVTKGLAKTIRAMADGTLDSQVGARICNGLGIMRASLETQKLEQLEARMDEIADRVAHERNRRGAGDNQHP